MEKRELKDITYKGTTSSIDITDNKIKEKEVYPVSYTHLTLPTT